MARWKAHVDFLLSVIELLFLFLTVEALEGKMCQTALLSGEGGSLWAKISVGRSRPWGIFFGFYKTRHILLSDSANCTVVRAVILTQQRRVTDRRTDGIAIASTAIAMRALRRAVKVMLTSLEEYFWATVSDGRVLHGSSLHSALGKCDYWAQTFIYKVM